MYLTERTHWSILGAEKDPQCDSFTFMAVLIVHSESNEERKDGELKRKRERKKKSKQYKKMPMAKAKTLFLFLELGA